MASTQLMRAILMLGLLSACVAQAESNAEGDLLQRVGSLYNLDGDSCVAILLDDNLVLTAAHCLFNESGRSLDPAELGFQQGQHRLRSVFAYALHPDFDATAEPSVGTIAADLALLRLTRPVSGFGALAQGQLVYEGDPVLLGFPDGLAPCRVARQAGLVMALDCRVELGNSGAAVLREQRGAPGQYEVVGVVSAFETAGDAYTAIAGELAIDLAEMGRQLPAPN